MTGGVHAPFGEGVPLDEFLSMGALRSLNAVLDIGGEKVAQITMAFPRASYGPGEPKEFPLRFFLPWGTFQSLLSKVD